MALRFPTTRIDFGALGAPEITCEIKDFKSLTAAEVKAVMAQDFNALGKLICGWNFALNQDGDLCAAGEEGATALPLPKDDPAVLEGQVPIGALEHIIKTIVHGVQPPNA